MAFTEAKQFVTIVGDRIFGSYKLTGDGSDAAWSAPCKQIDGAWIQEYTSGATGTSVSISWSANTLTFHVAPAASQVVHVFFIGV